MVQSLWSQHGALNHLPSLVYLLGENLTHQQLISPGTHYCWVGRGSTGWEVCLTLRHMSNSAPLPALPPTTLLPLSFATMSQACLTFALPPSVNHDWLYLVTISQSRLAFTLPPSVSQDQLFPCHHQSDTADFPCHQCLERLVPLSLMF